MTTKEEILATLHPVPEGDGDSVMVFIPSSLAAVCCDCGGTFILLARKCPGCGSAQYVLPNDHVTRKEGV